MIKAYYYLTKPGIVRGNLFTTAGGFFMAAQGQVDFIQLLLTVAGTAGVIASGCVFNNYLDRGIDKEMERTKKRPLVTGKISHRGALIFGTLLLIFGLLALTAVNILTIIVAITGFIFYVVVYGYFKRKSIHGTLVGSISGSTPPVIGYVAVTNSLDLGALLLFLILVMWQMPHFYAIGIFRRDEYKMAGIPILPVVKGIKATVRQIKLYAIGFVFMITLLATFGYVGFVYLAIMLAVSGMWLFKILSWSSVSDSNKWAVKVFSYSIIVLSVFSIIISIDFAFPFQMGI